MTNKQAIMVLECVDAHGLADTAKQMAIQALKEKEARKWIPVTERMPEEDGRYLCTYKNDAYGDGICIDFGLYEDGEWYVSGAIAWMPLPKPYTAGAEE